MVRDFKEDSQLQIDVYLKPTKDSAARGEAYLAKDTTSTPFGDNFEVVSFWVEDKIMIYPMDMIDHCEIYENERSCDV